MVDINTKMITLIGTPLSQSFAARMQNAGYEAAGLNMLYFYTEADNEHLGDIVNGIRYMNFAGFAVTKPNKVKVLQYLDHSMIYVLIAGSYTPFCLITLQGYTGIALLCAVWLIAIAGISLQAVLLHKADWINCLLYLSMGWLAVFVIDPLVSTLDSTGLALLVAGGLAYTVGVVFYIFERIPFSHAIWHTFVFAGTTLQFFSVLFYVIPGVNV